MMKVLWIIIISSYIAYGHVSEDFKNLAATNKESALYKSVVSENIDEFKYIIENNKEYINSIRNIETWYNYIPNLSTNNFSNFVKVLLDNGMDINKKNEEGKNLIL